MDWEKINQLAKMQILVGDQEIDSSDKLKVFLNAIFGIKRLLIIKADTDKGSILKRLKDYCDCKTIEFCRINGKSLTQDYIRGPVSIEYREGDPYSERGVPKYISEKKQMIVVRGLDKNTDLETLRAFMYMASLGSYYDNIENLPKDKLPYGSAFVFIADDEFPLKKFASISSYWHDESSVLDLRSFQAKVKDHMRTYNNNILGITEAGVYNYKNQPIKRDNYNYILPEGKEHMNIIEKYRTDFWDEYYPAHKKYLKRHMYFHHLNSSQAACINFFYPLMKNSTLNKILDSLNIEGDVKESCFEKISSLDKYKDGNSTNFDFYIELQTGIKVYFEIKYSEYDFGKAKIDEPKYIKKYKMLYESLVTRNPSINDAYKIKDFFLKNYQIMRNLVHIDNESYVVFLYPEGNKVVREAALNARKIIKDEWQNHFIPFTFEELVRQFNCSIDSQELKDYYTNDFTNKYLKY